jgi:hypothetical protein
MNENDLPKSLDDLHIDLKTNRLDMKNKHIAIISGSTRTLITIAVIAAIAVFVFFSIMFQPEPVMKVVDSEFVQYFVLIVRSIIKYCSGLVNMLILRFL